MPCTELGGLPKPLTSSKRFAGASEELLTLSDLLHFSADRVAFGHVTSLNATTIANVHKIIGHLPKDHWKREAQLLMTTNLAALQTIMSDFAIGPAVRDASSANSYKMPPESKNDRKLCGMQKMRKSGGFS
jgi:hypothetical protein